MSVRSYSPRSGSYSSKNYSTRNYSTGNYSTGNYSTGNYSTGNYSTGNYSTGNYSTGNYSAGNYTTSNYSPRNYSTVNYASDYVPSRIPYSSSSITRSKVSSERKNSDYSTSLSSKDDEKQRAGFNNLGNTCFMNAVLQCLCHTQPLIDYCVRSSYQRDLNYNSLSRGNLFKEFAELVKSSQDSKTAISPWKLQSEAQKYAPRFAGGRQNDAHEFLRYLLQGLHEDLSRTKHNFSLSGQKRYQDSNDSYIGDLFTGQLKSTLKCTSCNRDSVMHDPFWDISLPIPEESSSSSLHQLFNLFSYPEILDGQNKAFCEWCRQKNRCSKKMEINKFPKVLVIHLKRFSTYSFLRKLTIMVDCPLELRNLSEFSARSYYNSYSLYGVIDHIGTNHSGHYIAKCKDPKTKLWYEFNDSRVTIATDVISSNSYILFYIQD